jgi:hypothetical protein
MRRTIPAHGPVGQGNAGSGRASRVEEHTSNAGTPDGLYAAGVGCVRINLKVYQGKCNPPPLRGGWRRILDNLPRVDGGQNEGGKELRRGFCQVARRGVSPRRYPPGGSLFVRACYPAWAPGPRRPSMWNQHGQQVSIKAEPVGRPQRPQSRSQQDQHSRLAVNGLRQMGQQDGGPAAVSGAASRISDIANSPFSRDGFSFPVLPGEGHRFILCGEHAASRSPRRTATAAGGKNLVPDRRPRGSATRPYFRLLRCR